MTKTYNILVREAEGKRSLDRPRRRREKIRTNLKETGCELDTCGSGNGRAAACCNKPAGCIKGVEFPDQLRICKFLVTNAAPWSYQRAALLKDNEMRVLLQD
jgi:hypothetical protein